MTNLKRLVAALALLMTIGLTVLADCPVPGQIEGPPCVPAAQVTPDDPAAAGIMDGPPVVSQAPSVELPSLVEIAFNFLTLY
jgi:hypothetical protein